MDYFSYILGVIFAILAGFFSNLGSVLQKKVVNELPKDEPRFMRSLIKKPLWLMGLVSGLGVGTIFVLSAQVLIGPALFPGISAASGLIVLAIGSVKIVGENLKKEEIMGILMMIFAITLLGLSELQIKITETDFLTIEFITRMIIFTTVILIISVSCELLQKRTIRFKGVLLAIFSGSMFSLSTFYVSPLLATINQVIFEGIFNLGELILFIISSTTLVLVNMIGIMKIQQAFKHGQASNLVPIQAAPVQISPIFIYFFVFLLTPPSIFSTIYLFIGIFLIIISSFLLAKRQARLDVIK